jgi:hypothetical protein
VVGNRRESRLKFNSRYKKHSCLRTFYKGCRPFLSIFRPAGGPSRRRFDQRSPIIAAALTCVLQGVHATLIDQRWIGTEREQALHHRRTAVDGR